MESIDVSKLTLEQMIELQKKLEATLPDKKKNRLSELQSSIKEQIEKAGLSLEEVLKPMLPNKGGKKPTASSRKPAAVKYKQGDYTWTGKGRAPAWIVAFEDAGGKRESLRVDAANSEQKTE